MMDVIARYARWRYTKWPTGLAEKLPALRSDGTTTVPGLRVGGALTGVPLLKLAGISSDFLQRLDHRATSSNHTTERESS